MSRRTWIYNATLLAGLIFIILGVRLFFRDDVKGVIIHFVLALILFVSALLTGKGKNKKNERDDL